MARIARKSFFVNHGAPDEPEKLSGIERF